ncbi:MAG: putative lipid II flippase FtsW [Dehalococcoidia bacterium]|nr:putative lipid II flippase FtsW [Dehalococcoidia bacterium]
MAAASRTGIFPPGRPDFALLALTAVLTITGLVAVYSASFVIGLADFGDPHYYIIRQGAWAMLGVFLMVAAMRTDYRLYKTWAVPIMVVTIGMLIAVLVIGVEGGGAQRWLGVGELTIQPGEFAKLTVILYIAAWLSSKGDKVRSFEHGLMPFVIIIGLVGFLIMMQPSLGTTAIILAVTVTMFWVAGASIVQMAALGAAGIGAIATLATVAGYRADRLTAFFDADGDPMGNGFQTLQALIAMGNGGIDGLGLGASRSKFFYVPASHTDGIFAIIGEELGFIATAAVLGLYIILMVRGYQVARRAQDDFGTLVATGITTWIAVQALLNIGGITRVIPLTGVPLPFLSFGGNALAAVLLAMGVLISISRYGEQRHPHPEDDGSHHHRLGVVRRHRR